MHYYALDRWDETASFSHNVFTEPLTGGDRRYSSRTASVCLGLMRSEELIKII